MGTIPAKKVEKNQKMSFLSGESDFLQTLTQIRHPSKPEYPLLVKARFFEGGQRKSEGKKPVHTIQNGRHFSQKQNFLGKGQTWEGQSPSHPLWNSNNLQSQQVNAIWR